MDEDKIREAFTKVREDMSYFFEEMQQIKRTLDELTTQIREIKTIQHKTPTEKPIPTHNYPLESLKTQNSNISTGNEGVPTNKPTNQQTNQHPPISLGKPQKSRLEHLQRVSEILESLDELKKEVRIKFKKLTAQEMLIFSTIYQLDEEGHPVDYALVAEKLNLSEISIRDYVRKIISKGIPLDKTKEDNKKILLSVSPSLKRVASLPTILELREL